MKNTIKNMGSFTTVKLQAISRGLIAIIALVAVIGLLTACIGIPMLDLFGFQNLETTEYPASEERAQSFGDRTHASVRDEQPVSIPERATGIIVHGRSLAEKLNWLHRNAESYTEYSIVLGSNESLRSHTLYYSGKNDVTIQLIGSERERIISLSGSGSLFTIAGVTLVLDENLTLRGSSGNNAPLVMVSSMGELIMNKGSKITGNTNMTGGDITVSGGGVSVLRGGTFTMNDGEISRNSNPPHNGGGVCVNNGNFIMKGGIITGNIANNGGGVDVNGNGTFSLEGGRITGNTASNHAGGVGIDGGATCMMTGGEIIGNTPSSPQVIRFGTFIMTGGIVLPPL